MFKSKYIIILWPKSEFLKKFIQKSGLYTINFKPILFASSYSNLKEKVVRHYSHLIIWDLERGFQIFQN